MGNTSCKCRKANCELNSRYFILSVDDGSPEARELHLFPLQVDVDSFFAGNPSKLLSASPPLPPPYQHAKNSINSDEDNEKEVDEENNEMSGDEDKERKKKSSESSENIINTVNIQTSSINVKPFTTADWNDKEISKSNEGEVRKNDNNNNHRESNNKNADNNDTQGEEGKKEVKKSTVIFQMYLCQSHLSSKEEVVHLKAIVMDGNNQGTGHVRYEREGLKAMIASAVPHAELGSWYQWQLLSPISSVPIPLSELSIDTPIRLFNVSDQTYLSFYNDNSYDPNNHFGNQGAPVTFFLKPLHPHFLSSSN